MELELQLELQDGRVLVAHMETDDWAVFYKDGNPVMGALILEEPTHTGKLFIVTMSAAGIDMETRKACGPVFFSGFFASCGGSGISLVPLGENVFLEQGEYTFCFHVSLDGEIETLTEYGFRPNDISDAAWGPQQVDTRDIRQPLGNHGFEKRRAKNLDEWEDESRTHGGWFNPHGELRHGDDPGGDGIQIFEGAYRRYTPENLLGAIRIAQRIRTCAVDIKTGRPLEVGDWLEDGKLPFNLTAGTDQRIPYFEPITADKPWNVGVCKYENIMRSWKHHDNQHMIRSVEYLTELMTWASEPIVRKWAARTIQLRVNHVRTSDPDVEQKVGSSLKDHLESVRAKPHALGGGDRGLAWELYIAAMGWTYLDTGWRTRNYNWIHDLAQMAALTTLSNGMAMARGPHNQNWTAKPWRDPDVNGFVVPQHVECCLTFQQNLIDLGKYAILKCGIDLDGDVSRMLRSQIIHAQRYMDVLNVKHEHQGKSGPPYVLPVKVKGGAAFEDPPFGWGNGPSKDNDPAARAACFDLTQDLDYARMAFEAIGSIDYEKTWAENAELAHARVWEDTREGNSASVRMGAQVLQVCNTILNERDDSGQMPTLPQRGEIEPPEVPEKPEEPEEPPILEETPIRTVVVNVPPEGEIHLILRSSSRPSPAEGQTSTEGPARERAEPPRRKPPRRPRTPPGNP